MILVAIGANIPGTSGSAPQENCERALELLETDGLTVVARSRWYRSSPWPRSDQPDYVNGVTCIEAHGSPEALLQRLHAIEAQMGRVRGAPNISRTIDLDLLAYGQLIRGAPTDGDPMRLQLPHPRLHERAFVLFPLSDIAPTWIHPASGRSVAEMIADLADDQDCAVIESPLNKMPRSL
jgi:2-amino-4-hydroxy-6-hydroxymethyldihydropteridine diphosphokinase